MSKRGKKLKCGCGKLATRRIGERGYCSKCISSREDSGLEERFNGHCFVPQEEDQLLDRCAYPDCERREMEHEWTVEAYRCNPSIKGASDE